jgi:hypothetical protein
MAPTPMRSMWWTIAVMLTPWPRPDFVCAPRIVAPSTLIAATKSSRMAKTWRPKASSHRTTKKGRFPEPASSSLCADSPTASSNVETASEPPVTSVSAPLSLRAATRRSTTQAPAVSMRVTPERSIVIALLSLSASFRISPSTSWTVRVVHAPVKAKRGRSPSCEASMAGRASRPSFFGASDALAFFSAMLKAVPRPLPVFLTVPGAAVTLCRLWIGGHDDATPSC